MSLRDRLKQSRAKQDKTQADVAFAVGMSQPAYQALESGKNQKSAFLPLIAQYLEVDPLWLATGKNQESVIEGFDVHSPILVNENSDNRYIWIDIVEATFSCGNGESIEFHFDTIEGRFPFPTDFFRNKGVCKNNMRIIKAKGDSMTDLIKDGDYVGIDIAQTEIIDGEIYAIYFAGEGMVKQIFKEADGSVILHSLNPRYRDRVVNEQNGSSFRVMGRQFWRAG